MKYRAFALLLALGLAATPATPQIISLAVDEVEQVGRSVTDDGDTALVCSYIGTEESGTIEVIADGNIVFKSGASGSEAADDSLECPVSAPLGGIVDVSDTACDTMVEVLDIINASASEFRCVPVDALGTDGMDGTLLLQAETAANTASGLTLPWDTSDALELTTAFTQRRTLNDYCSGTGVCVDLLTSDDTRNRNPEPGLTTVLTSAYEVSTYASGSSVTVCYSSSFYFDSTNGFNETLTEVWRATNGATTVATLYDDELAGGIFSKPGERLICRIDNSAALGTATLTGNALQYPH